MCTGVTPHTQTQSCLRKIYLFEKMENSFSQPILPVMLLQSGLYIHMIDIYRHTGLGYAGPCMWNFVSCSSFISITNKSL